jgi:hypothetical protein
MFISKLHLFSSNFFFCVLILCLQNYLILLFSLQHSFLCERYPTPSRSSTFVQYITFRFYLSGLPDLMRTLWTVVLILFRRFNLVSNLIRAQLLLLWDFIMIFAWIWSWISKRILYRFIQFLVFSHSERTIRINSRRRSAKKWLALPCLGL